MPHGPHTDTTPEVLALQAEAWRRMTPSARVRLAWELGEAARSLLRARLRAQNPDWTDQDIALALTRSVRDAGPGAAPWS